jgi:putative ABC transport system permease protein
MFDLDRWTEIAVTLRSNRLRTFLTAAGVFWGMFMLVVMLGFGDGLERGIKRSMSGFATNSVYVWGRRTSMPYKGMRPGRRLRYDNADAAALAELPGIEFLAPRNQLGGHRGGANVSRGAKTGNYAVMGDMPEFGHIQPLVFEEGRFVNHIDVQEYRKVAVIGRQVYDELFVDATDPIGQSIRVRGVYFQVVGLFHAPGNDDRADRYNATIHIPFTTFQRVFNFGDFVGWFAMTGHPDVTGSALEAEARKVLAERHKVHPDDENAIGAFNAEEEFRKITVLFRGIRLFVWFVGVMTLAAGVVGVSNIMLIVVQERTREIGLRRAVGATPASVVGMVLQESLVLTAVAGYAGLVAAVVALELAGMVVGPDHETMGQPQVDLAAALLAGVVLLVAGALAGVIPARTAASVNPVQALHAE